MNVLNRSTSKSRLSGPNREASGLSLYNEYGAVAYGVILKIVPQPQQAQELLIDLFASPSLQSAVSKSTSAICTIVRLSRTKAIEYRQQQRMPALDMPAANRQTDLIFDLLFCHNQSPDAIAEQLQIPRSAVFGAVREFFASHQPS